VKRIFAIAIIAAFMMPLALTIVTASATASPLTTQSPPSNPSTGNMNRDNALANAQQRNMFGIFSYDHSLGNVSGRFLTFIVDEATGTVTDYTIKRDTGSILLFTMVQPLSFTSSGTGRTDGAMFMLNGSKMLIMAHNNPPAILLYRTQGQGNTVNYTLASGFVASVISGTSNVAIDGNGQHALLLVENGTATIDRSTISVVLQPWAKAVARFQPDIGLYAQVSQSQVQQAISSGELACECSMVLYNGTVEQDFTGYQERLTLRVQEAVQNRIQLQVSAEFSTGKIVIISVDNGTLNARTAAEIGLTIDGVRLQQTMNLGEVFTATGTENKYSVAADDGAYQIVLYIGHFSDHTIVLEAVSEQGGLPASLVIPLIALVAIVAIVALVAIARKRQTA